MPLLRRFPGPLAVKDPTAKLKKETIKDLEVKGKGVKGGAMVVTIPCTWVLTCPGSKTC